MDAKLKAKELVDKFMDDVEYCAEHLYEVHCPCIHQAKQCSLIYVDGIIELMRTLHKPEYTVFLAKDLYTIENTEYQDYYHGYDISEYFEEVKLEINKL